MEIIQYLREFIRTEGRNLGHGILKLDTILTHQIRPGAMASIGREFARRFSNLGTTRVVTAEISGIAPAVMTGLALGVPVVFARKTRPATMLGEAYTASARSHTKGETNDLVISAEFLGKSDRVLIIDDFLARGDTSVALLRLVDNASATPVSLGVVVEKAFENGRARLEGAGFGEVPVESLVRITDMENGRIVLAE